MFQSRVLAEIRGLFRTFGVPSISALLHRTEEFERRAQKRYDDTDIIVSEMMEHGYDSERGRAALAKGYNIQTLGP